MQSSGYTSSCIVLTSGTVRCTACLAKTVSTKKVVTEYSLALRLYPLITAVLPAQEAAREARERFEWFEMPRLLSYIENYGRQSGQPPPVSDGGLPYVGPPMTGVGAYPPAAHPNGAVPNVPLGFVNWAENQEVQVSLLFCVYLCLM